MEKGKQTYKLPEGWVWTTIGDVGIVQSGGTPSTRNREFWGDEISWITPADLSGYKEKYISKGNRSLSKIGLEYSSAKLLPKGTILFSSRAPIGYTVIAKIELATNQGFKNLIPTKSLNSEYVYYYFQTLKFQAEKVASGTTFLELSATNFSKLPFPLAPLLEQQRIVSKIESLFSELDQAGKGLQKAKQQLEVYRQALLKNAFEGKLTKQWRMEVNPVKAEKLLNLVKKERQKQYEQDIATWKKLVEHWDMDGKKENKPEKPFKLKVLPDFDAKELNEYPELPPEWIWTKIDKLCENDKHAIKAGPFGSSLKKQFYVKNGYKIYGQEQVIADDAHLGDYYINEEKYKELISCKVKPSDILISLVGTVGKVLILPENCENGIINPRLLKLSLDTSYYLPKIFKFYFESLFLKNLYSTHTHGATMNVLNLGIVQKLPFPFMSVDEQMIIIQKLESQFSIIDKLQQTIDSSIRKAIMYRHSILKKAFTGKLVSSDANDENAYELLKKIKKEKAEYLKAQKELDKLKPKKKRQMEKKKTVLEILESSDKPIASKELWQQSIHHDDIEAFYDELKEIYHRLSEIKENTESFLTLKK